jgi:hypothetical protein
MKLAELDINKIYSYTDYLKWRIEERIEFIKGKIFAMGPAPTTTHQIISSYILYALIDFLEGQNCMTFAAPLMSGCLLKCRQK